MDNKKQKEKSGAILQQDRPETKHTQYDLCHIRFKRFSEKDNLSLTNSEQNPKKNVQSKVGENKNFCPQHPKNKLTKFAKELIESCMHDPKNSVYKTYKQLMIFCPKKNYTIKQVGWYLRKIRAKHQLLNEFKSTIIKNTSSVRKYVRIESAYNNVTKNTKNVKHEHYLLPNPSFEEIFFSGDVH